MSVLDADVRTFARVAIGTRASPLSSPRQKRAAVVSTADMRRHDILARLEKAGIEWTLARLTPVLADLVARGAMLATRSGGYRAKDWDIMAGVAA